MSTYFDDQWLQMEEYKEWITTPVIATPVLNARCAPFQETKLNFLIWVKGPLKVIMLVKTIVKELLFIRRPVESHSHLIESNHQSHHLQPSAAPA